MKIYINGVLEDTDSYTGPLLTNNDDLYIGTIFNAGGGSCYGNYLKGSIDELAIWNRALNSTEIYDIWDNTQ